MIEIAILFVMFAFCGWAALCRTSKQRAKVYAERCSLRMQELQEQHEAQRAALRQLSFASWWARNAAETSPADTARSHYFRFAVAALLAPDLRTLHRELASQSDPEEVARGKITESQRIAAVLAASELAPVVMDGELHKTPWEEWARHTAAAGQQRPPHNAQAVREAFMRSLERWDRLVPGLRYEPPPVVADGSPSNSA